MVLHMQPVIYNWYLVTYDIGTKRARQAWNSVTYTRAHTGTKYPWFLVLNVRLTSVPVGSWSQEAGLLEVD